jgi:TatA/E family protein of Tat protein translocase
MFGLQPVHLIFILVIALIVVGPGKLPDVGASLGKTIKEFRKAATDVQDATSMTGTPAAAPAAAPAPAPAPVQAAPAPVQAAPVPAPLVTAVAAPLAEAVAAPVAAVSAEAELVHPVTAAPEAPAAEAGA